MGHNPKTLSSERTLDPVTPEDVKKRYLIYSWGK